MRLSDRTQLELATIPKELNVCCQEGYTALIWAASGGHINLVNALLAMPSLDGNYRSKVTNIYSRTLF